MDEIQKLLEQADAPRDRAYLLVMYKIADKLSDLHEKLQAHRDEFIDHRDATNVRQSTFDVKFDAHVDEEQRLLNRGLGAWMVITAMLVGILGFGGWYIARHILDVATAQQITIERSSNRLTAIEALVEQHIKNGARP